MLSACVCGAEYERVEDCPRCGSDSDDTSEREPWRFGQALDEPPACGLLPDLPDGPDDLLAHIAELEAQVAGARERLERTPGARTCRYCHEDIPPGPTAGVHDECLPSELPEGARSCTGCAELILDDDDELEHDVCVTAADPEWLAQEYAEDLIETEPMAIDAAAHDEPLTHSDEVLCSCGRWLPLSFVAPLGAVERSVVSAVTVSCACLTRVTVTYAWARGCMVGVRFERSTFTLN